MLDYLLRIFEQNKNQDAVVWKERIFSYADLITSIQRWQHAPELKSITTGQVVVLEADFSPNAISLFFVLMNMNCILVPLTSAASTKKEEYLRMSQAGVHLKLDDNDHLNVVTVENSANHPLYQTLKDRSHPGLVLFSSGSTGQSKAVVHDLAQLSKKFQTPKKLLRTISFLLYDHIGGFNTMIYTLANGGCLVTVEDRTPKTILSVVEKYRVELLPASPTFLNLLLISKQYENYDLSSLKLITYGTEPMPESTLKQLSVLFPHIQLRQTYGLSEVGILSTQSQANDSLWMKVGGQGFQTRVRDGKLEIKAESAMLGYLNAPSPFTVDGWFQTGDAVEVNGEYIKILGRTSELINVGGEKVYPQEIENIILQMDHVKEVVVYAEPHVIMGHIVCAKVHLDKDEPKELFSLKLKKYCAAHLEHYKVPVKVLISHEELHTPRLKKKRLVA